MAEMAKMVEMVKKNQTLIINSSSHSSHSSHSLLLNHIAEYGLNSVKGLPDWFYKVFVTTHDIAPD